jgi:hypothetical protein
VEEEYRHSTSEPACLEVHFQHRTPHSHWRCRSVRCETVQGRSGLARQAQLEGVLVDDAGPGAGVVGGGDDSILVEAHAAVGEVVELVWLEAGTAPVELHLVETPSTQSNAAFAGPDPFWDARPPPAQQEYQK